MSDIRIGISGWTYEPWRGTFYPKDLAQKKELWYASRQLNSIEINGSFYSLQTPSSYRKWHDETPDDFVFSIKGGRFITHIRRLRNVGPALANFFASGVLALNEKLGPILWQLPPNMKFDAPLLQSFFDLLPRDTKEAAALARRHDDRLKGRAFLKPDGKRPVRHAMEVRHESFKDPAFVRLLRANHVALVVADTAGKWPYMEDVTADFVYCRLHGDEELYVSGYTDEALDRWAEKFRGWRRKRDVFVYFDNDVKVRAPFDAMSLSARLGLRTAPSDNVDAKTITETPRREWPTIQSSRTRRKSRVRARVTRRVAAGE
jgi:uncharacterized protein YecE (DUF72 family)